MENNKRQIPLTKNGPREVSNFVGQELLFDYLTGRLDSIRREAVEQYINKSKEAQADLEKMKVAQAYLEQLSRTGVAQEFLEDISEPTTYFTELFKKTRFEKWPTGVKWGLEALGVVAVIVTILVVIPWDQALKVIPGRGSEEIILAEVARSGGGSEAPQQTDTAQFQDEGIKPPAVAVPPAIPVKEEAKVVAKSETKAPTIATSTVAKVQNETSLPKGVPAAESGGFLYRGDIAVTNLEAGVPKMISRIEELGGRKAGDVRLGWSKSPNSSYFHFTIPAAKYNELMQFMTQFGKVRISKEKHPRVMPDGIIRLILTAEEAKP